jgi:photosystem II Psb27 protein
MLSVFCLLAGAVAFQPAVVPCRGACRASTPVMSEQGSSRRTALAGLAAATFSALPALPALAAEYKLKKDYPSDARNMLENMKIATDLKRGEPNMEATVKTTRSEMNDFVAFYRRQPKVAGMPSFSTMYTAINTLSGHYASYGNKYPVPEKRRTRLQQQYKEIERALARGK